MKANLGAKHRRGKMQLTPDLIDALPDGRNAGYSEKACKNAEESFHKTRK
jgi:hypothetical protein